MKGWPARALALALTLLSVTSPAAELSPQLAILSPLEFDVTGNGYVASLGARFLTIPLASMEAGVGLVRRERYSIAALLRIGYGQKNASTRLAELGNPAVETQGSLSWMPVLFGARTRFFISSIPFFRPSLTAGFGGAWLRFTPERGATLDTVIPLVFLTPAIHIFEPIEALAGTVFQGFTFGLSYQRALFSVQRFQALAFEVSAQWTL